MSKSRLKRLQESRLYPSAAVRARSSEEGTVLLNLRTGKYYALNELGHVIWMQISELGATRSELLGAVSGSAGEPMDTVANEVDCFLASMRTLRLISDTAPVRRQPKSPAACPAPGGDGDRPKLHWLHGAAVSALSWFALVMVDLIGRIWGFHGVCWLAERAVTLRWPRSWTRDAEALYASVMAGCIFYFKPVLCLQRAAVTTLVLRLHGLPASVMIGIHQYPFAAHAWAELDGRTITDPARVRDVYAPIACF
jgi:hypothetical protein